MVRKLFLISVVLLLGNCFSFGQPFQLQLKVASNPPQFIIEWENQKQLVMLTITAPAGTAPMFRIGSEIRSGGKVVARTDLKRMPVQRLDQPVKIFYTDDVMPAGALNVTLPDNKLPEGNYDLCVQLFDEAGQRALTQPVCQPFSIRSYQQPQLIFPADKTTLLPAQAKTIQFRWTPVSPAPTGMVTYKLQVFEVMSGQYPEQAVRSNQPVLEKDLPGATQFIWIPQNDIQPNQYVWTVQALDREGRPLGKNEGRATPYTFFLRSTTPSPPNCNLCGYWKPINLINSSTNQTLSVSCGNTYHVPCNQLFYAPNLTYQCKDSNCVTTCWLWIYGPSGLITNSGINSINNPPNGIFLNFNTNQPGTYSLKYFANCGQKSCDTCIINIVADCELNNCKCGIWKILTMKPDEASTNNTTALSCGKTYPVLCNKKYDFQYKYQCSADTCKTSYTFQMKDPQGNIVSTSSNISGTDTFTFTATGTYTQTITAACGGKVCDSCKIYFVANCPPLCCTELLKNIRDQQPWIAGNQLYINSIFLASQPVQAVEATVISMQSTVACTNPVSSTTQPAASVITGGTLSGYAVVMPQQAEIHFSNGSSTTVSPLIQLQLPPPPASVNCQETIKICIRYLLRYANCKTCEVVRCYNITRKGGIAFPDGNQGKN
jgi:hypothetical protein